jgi:hypothetical protein
MDWQEERKQIRRKEKQMRKEYKMAKQMSVGALEGDPKSLINQLKRFLPEHLIPSNIGGYDRVAWPFWFSVDFDFGSNPTITNASRQTKNFQVTQEAGFLMMAIFRKSYEYGTSGELGPWNIEVRDRQSSRQFNDRPIPMQMIGKKSRPTILPTPMMISPNAFIDVTMSSWLPDGVSQATTGSGKHQFTFFGYRTRVENTEQLMSLIYG